uniref:Uncharacterized protein n=1 Tax=Glossina pallidipes TaxID=7398 RepID=A0A1A9ZIK7_GLOPL
MNKAKCKWVTIDIFFFLRLQGFACTDYFARVVLYLRLKSHVFYGFINIFLCFVCVTTEIVSPVCLSEYRKVLSHYYLKLFTVSITVTVHIPERHNNKQLKLSR